MLVVWVMREAHEVGAQVAGVLEQACLRDAAAPELDALAGQVTQLLVPLIAELLGPHAR